jgi:hypothetical protein
MSKAAIDGFDTLLTVLPFWMRDPVTRQRQKIFLKAHRRF